MDSSASHHELVKKHYLSTWAGRVREVAPPGPIVGVDRHFSVLVREPDEARSMSTYATCGMSIAHDGAEPGLEVHVFAREAHEAETIELLAAVAHYHLTSARLALHHTVYFGRPWVSGSVLEYGFLSLPYLDGGDFEWRRCNDSDVRFLWLIPISASERAYKKRCGAEALEELFEASSFAYDDARRQSLI